MPFVLQYQYQPSNAMLPTCVKWEAMLLFITGIAVRRLILIISTHSLYIVAENETPQENFAMSTSTYHVASTYASNLIKIWWLVENSSPARWVGCIRLKHYFLKTIVMLILPLADHDESSISPSTYRVHHVCNSLCNLVHVLYLFFGFQMRSCSNTIVSENIKHITIRMIHTKPVYTLNTRNSFFAKPVLTYLTLWLACPQISCEIWDE